MTWDDDSDPYIQVGPWSCEQCGGEAWPVNAAWLTSELVIATLGQRHLGGCRGPRVWAAIIDTRAGHQSLPYPPAGNGRQAREHYRRRCCRACGALTAARYCDTCRCTALTAQLKRCTNKARPGGICAVHGAPGRAGNADRSSNGRGAVATDPPAIPPALHPGPDDAG